jgi:hypothetical protein
VIGAIENKVGKKRYRVAAPWPSLASAEVTSAGGKKALLFEKRQKNFGRLACALSSIRACKQKFFGSFFQKRTAFCVAWPTSKMPGEGRAQVA